MSLNLLTALFLTIAGFTMGTRQIVLSPRNVTFPCAPDSVRVAMFLAAVALAGLAMMFYGHRTPYAGEAAVPIAAVCGVVALYNSIMLWNVIGQRRPPGVWERINRYEARAAAPDRRSSGSLGATLRTPPLSMNSRH